MFVAYSVVNLVTIPMIFKSIDSLLNKVTSDMCEVDRLIDRLNDEGYDANFVLERGKLKCLQTRSLYILNQVRIEKVYQVEDPLIGWNGYYIYAIHEPISNIKGVFMTQLIKTGQVK
jgi:hypothetical protein